MTAWFYIVLIVLAGLIIGGFVACFWGYRRFFSGIKATGFFIGGLLGFLIALVFAFKTSNTTQIVLILVAGFIIGGVVGFMVSITLNKILTFLAGGLIGFFLSVLILSPGALAVIFGTRFSPEALRLALGNAFPVHIIIAIIFGVLAVLFQRPIIIISTAIWGAAWAAVALAVAYYMMNKPIKEINLSLVSSAISEYPVFIFIAWIGLAAVGIFFQFHETRKDKDKKKKEVAAPTS